MLISGKYKNLVKVSRNGLVVLPSPREEGCGIKKRTFNYIKIVTLPLEYKNVHLCSIFDFLVTTWKNLCLGRFL